jgi:colanic acid/amylovoran biosynthesis glycosyltransferase
LSVVPGPPRYAVIVSRFPKLTETFVVQELVGLEQRGLDFELYAITHESAEQLQPEAAGLDSRAHYSSIVSVSSLVAQLYWLTHSPGVYVRTWARAILMGRRPREARIRTVATVVLAMSMARQMVDREIDRVHAHWATYPTLAAWVIKRLTGIPYSFTGHAHDILIDFGGLDVKVAAADLVLTCTTFGRDIIIERSNPRAADKVVVVHHGVDLERFVVVPMAERGASRQLHLLCVGTFQEYKGHRYLFEACRLLVDNGIDVSLELVGDGELRAHLEALVGELKLADRVVFRGRQSSEVVREAIRRCDVCVLPSVQMDNGQMDGIPNVLVEAMAMGRPAVGTILPGVRELITDNETGLLAEPRDPASLARALTRLVDEPDLAQRLVVAGRAKVEAEHDAAVCLDEVYQRLASLPSSTDASTGA